MDIFKQIASDYVEKEKSENPEHACEGCLFFAFMMGAYSLLSLRGEMLRTMNLGDAMIAMGNVAGEIVSWEGEYNKPRISDV